MMLKVKEWMFASIYLFFLPTSFLEGEEEMQEYRGTQIAPLFFAEQRLLLQVLLLGFTWGQPQPKEAVIRCQAPESVISSASEAAVCKTTKADTQRY